ncbi:MAG: hypothetical protein J6S13_05630 [Clostridia bacterium]|nr:hypothetical protein [Clostridia bacterium]
MTTAQLLKALAAQNPRAWEDVHSVVGRLGNLAHWHRTSASKSKTGKAYITSYFEFPDRSELRVLTTEKGEVFEFQIPTYA